ncbi:NAD(P)-dependent oxidoreductase [Peribacillus butanolivorans]|uniref:NAD(P)-dependent oxidoreductase n=1 Tax=Peribacillus butanolivorans TaxID=421767 RepID=UPI003D2A5D45
MVLTLPLTDATHHIINRDILLAMKPKACLINFGRGALIDEGDLIPVMQSGHLQAASSMYLRKNHCQKTMSSGQC